MRLAQTGQQFADLQHMFRQPEVAVRAQPAQVHQAVLRALDAVAHEGVGFGHVVGMVQYRVMRSAHRLGDSG